MLAVLPVQSTAFGSCFALPFGPKFPLHAFRQLTGISTQSLIKAVDIVHMVETARRDTRIFQWFQNERGHPRNNFTPFNERHTSDKVFLGVVNKLFLESNNYGLGRVIWILLGGITLFSLVHPVQTSSPSE
ncbi:hypothetical protein EDD15DRAFT_2518721 [Pisolithus albus]|nr:hypothetical protein EDD15DRAFT_2518721 [Pisolithus albus]